VWASDIPGITAPRCHAAGVRGVRRAPASCDAGVRGPSGKDVDVFHAGRGSGARALDCRGLECADPAAAAEPGAAAAFRAANEDAAAIAWCAGAAPSPEPSRAIVLATDGGGRTIVHTECAAVLASAAAADVDGAGAACCARKPESCRRKMRLMETALGEPLAEAADDAGAGAAA
jgi:hypothetical protein